MISSTEAPQMDRTSMASTPATIHHCQKYKIEHLLVQIQTFQCKINIFTIKFIILPVRSLPANGKCMRQKIDPKIDPKTAETCGKPMDCVGDQ